jgi:hypothetical protein
MEKWERARGYLLEMKTLLDQNASLIHKVLKSQCGFLVYLTRTYPSLVSYLKGIHLTLDSWWPGQDSEGWRVSN